MNDSKAQFGTITAYGSELLIITYGCTDFQFLCQKKLVVY